MIAVEKRVELLKVIAHPMRIKILEELTGGVKCVSKFEDSLDISRQNISEHLALLRASGVVDFFIDGWYKCYFLKEPFIPDLLELLRKQYKKDIPAPAGCLANQEGAGPDGRRGTDSPQHTITLYVNDPMGNG